MKSIEKMKGAEKMSKNPKTISDEARRARNEYLRSWRAKNKDKVKQYAIDHWERTVARQREAETKADE